MSDQYNNPEQQRNPELAPFKDRVDELDLATGLADQAVSYMEQAAPVVPVVDQASDETAVTPNTTETAQVAEIAEAQFLPSRARKPATPPKDPPVAQDDPEHLAYIRGLIEDL